MRSRRGFTLLEVMISLAILMTSLGVLLKMQTSAAYMTLEAERISTATWLAQEKLAEVRLLVEYEGFQVDEVYDEGDFDDFGDEAFNLQFEALDEYHWEYLVYEVDLEAMGDGMAAADNISGMLPGGGGGGEGAMANTPDLGSSFGGFLSGDMIAQQLNPFIREVKVRVWWGDDSEDAKEEGNEVVLTTHLSNPGGFGGFGGGGGLDSTRGGNAAEGRNRRNQRRGQMGPQGGGGLPGGLPRGGLR